MFVWDRGAQIGKVTRRVRAILPQHFRQEQDMPNGRFLLRRHIRMGKFRQWRNGASCRQGTHLDPGRICSSYFNFESADVLKDYDIVQCAPYTIRLTRKTDKSKHMEIELDP